MHASAAGGSAEPGEQQHRRLALSPSRAGDFKQCPLRYRLRAIDRLPERPGREQVRGSLVHAVLESLFGLPAPERTPDAAGALVAPVWEEFCAQEPGLAQALFPGRGAADPELSSWLGSAGALLEAYFRLEDPRRVEPQARELLVETELASGLLLRGYIDRVDVAPTGQIRLVDYKGLALGTPMATPTGWTTMAEVQVGDALLGATGAPCRVIAKSQVHRRPCYEVRFTDGSRVVADNVHLWPVHVPSASHDGYVERVMSTEEVHRHLLGRPLTGRGRRRPFIRATAPVELPEADLPVPPWTLGAWLGGATTRGGEIGVGPADRDDVVRLLTERGHEHVPGAYLRASCGQRLALLQGLMDTAGSWSDARRRAVFVTTSAPLARAVRELVHTLGATSTARTTSHRSRRGPRVVHTVAFRPHGFDPFSLPRKAVEVDTWSVGSTRPRRGGVPRELRRTIAAVDPIDPVATQCVMVDAPDSLYLCGDTLIPTHNTGSAPREGAETSALFQMKFYALALLQLRGRVPSQLRLLYLGDETSLTYEPDEGELRRFERTLDAIWAAILEAGRTGDFRPSPSWACEWCSYRPICPAWDGTPPPYPGWPRDPEAGESVLDRSA